MSTFGRFAIAAAAVLAVLAPGAIHADQAKPDASSVNVTVKYTGKGTVDAKHRLWVWLFEDPNIGPQSIPIGEQSIDKNGGTAAFPNVASTKVYIAVAYDEAGGFAGQAPPPPGSPIAMYGVKGPNDTPQPITPGTKASVTMAFNDAQRMQ